MTKILIIGEARGATEDEYNHGFTGSSGIELSFMLHDAGLTHNHILFCSKCNSWQSFPQCSLCLESLYPSPNDMIRFWSEVKSNFDFEITNVFEVHPENNDLGQIFSPQRNSFLPGLKYNPKRPISYVKPEYFHHVENLWKRILETKPNLCLLLGNTACWAVLQQVNISAIRGTITQSEKLGVKCLSTWHPANILRDWSNRAVALADFKKAQRECEFPQVKRVRRKVIYNADLETIRNWLSLPSDRYTIDIESGYALYTKAELDNMTKQMRYLLSSQISMIGFSREHKKSGLEPGLDSLVIEFMTRNKPNLSLSKQIPKTFQNGCYDMVRMLYMGLETIQPRDDTMLRHHSYLPEMKKGLGFLGSIYANEPPWKLMYSKGESLKGDS